MMNALRAFHLVLERIGSDHVLTQFFCILVMNIVLIYDDDDVFVLNFAYGGESSQPLVDMSARSSTFWIH